MEKIKQRDQKYGLNFTPFAEDLGQKFLKDQQNFRSLKKEIDNGTFIQKCTYNQQPLKISLKEMPGSGGHYMRFGNNKIQDIIQKQQVEIAKKKI